MRLIREIRVLDPRDFKSQMKGGHFKQILD